MATASSTTDSTKPAAQRRPLFNRPAWSKPQVTSNAADFFSRSDQTYRTVIADEERRRKKRLAKKTQEQAIDEDGGGKRRRISIDSDSDHDDSRNSSDDDVNAVPDEGASSSMQVGADVKSPPQPISSPKPAISPKALTERYESTIAAARLRSEQASHSNVIELENNEDSHRVTRQGQEINKSTITKSQKPTVYDDFEVSDEEFPELARQAREKARRKRLQADFPSDLSPDHAVPDSNGLQSIQSQPVHTPTPPPQVSEQIVSILITSRITNTKPLIVNRKINQRLKDVRLAWCQRQGFTPETIATVLLVWRGRRLFDVTSCKSLGIGVDANGNIITKGEKDILGEENRQVHMEAMTEEMFERQKKGKEASRQIVPERPNIEDAVVQQAPQEPQVRIILKTKGFDDFKLIVKHVCYTDLGLTCQD